MTIQYSIDVTSLFIQIILKHLKFENFPTEIITKVPQMSNVYLFTDPLTTDFEAMSSVVSFSFCRHYFVAVKK